MAMGGQQQRTGECIDASLQGSSEFRRSLVWQGVGWCVQVIAGQQSGPIENETGRRARIRTWVNRSKI